MPSGIYIRTPDMKTGKHRKGCIVSKETKEKISETLKRKGIKPISIGWNKKYFTIQEKIEAKKKKDKRYRENHKNKIRLYKQFRRALERKNAPLSIKIIQMVYEDNIKKYGTLTCIYCLKPISFGKDTLEHKQPLFKNGTHDYSNLAITCRSCNCSKQEKTEEEYKQYLLFKTFA